MTLTRPALRKHGSAGAIQIACERIEDHALPKWCRPAFRGGHHDGPAARAQDLRAQHPAEIPGAEVSCRDRGQHGVAHALERAFPIREEEQLVLLDGSADAAAVDVSVAFRFVLDPGAILVPGEARSLLLSCIANALPWKSLVPDFVITVTAAPPVMPCSASKLLVEMFTSWMLSTGGTYTAWCGIVTRMSAEPSTRVLLAPRSWPLTLVVKARPGVSVTAF